MVDLALRRDPLGLTLPSSSASSTIAGLPVDLVPAIFSVSRRLVQLSHLHQSEKKVDNVHCGKPLEMLSKERSRRKRVASGEVAAAEDDEDSCVNCALLRGRWQVLGAASRMGIKWKLKPIDGGAATLF